MPDQFLVTNEAGYQIDPRVPDLSPSIGQAPVTHIVNAPNWNITKTADPSTFVEPADPLTYTLTIENNGHLATEGAYTITDVIPANTNFVSADFGGVYSDPIRTVTWVFTDPLDINDDLTVSYGVTVTLPLTDGTLIVNDDYQVTGGNVFSDAVGPPVTVTVRTPVTLTLTKVDDPDPVPAGDIINYTLTVTNDPGSKGPATDVVVTDTIPANTSFLSAGFVGPINGTVTPGPTITNPLYVTWALSSPLTIGSSVDMTMSVVVTSPLVSGTLINNLYEASASNTIFAVDIDPPVVTTTVVSTPTLDLTKVGSAANVQAGELFTYTITYSNSGNADASNVLLTDTLDPNVSFDSVDGTPVGVHDGSPSGGIVTWNLGSLAGEGAGSGILTVTVRVNEPLPNDSLITNTVDIIASEGVTNTDVVTTLVNSTPEFQLTKSVVPTPTVQAGELLTYTLELLNVGNANAVDAVLTDVIPLNTQFFTATAGFSPANPLPNGPVTWPISSVLVGVPQTYVLVLQVDTPLPNGTLITNSAVISSPLDRAESNVVTTTVESTPTLQVFKVGLPEPVSAGELITYTISYTNAGNADATTTVITDIFPAGTSFESATPLGTAVVSPTGRQWSIGTLPGDGGTGTITLTLRTDTPQDNGTVLTNSVTLAAEATTPATAIATNTITSTPILEITKLESEDPIKAGNQLIYTLTYTNTGNMNASGVTISDIYEGPFAAIAASSPGVVVTSPLPAQISWNLGTVPADNTPRTQLVTVTLPSSVQDNTVITNTVSITSAQNLGDSDSITTTVSGRQADLQLAKSRNGTGDVLSGGQINYTLVVTNAGPDTVNAIVTDSFNGTEGTFVSCTPAAICDGSTLPVVWTLNNFTGTQTLSLVIDSSDTFSGTLTNSAIITLTSSLDLDPDPSNNTDSVDTVVRYPTADLAITKTRENSGEIIAGDEIIYRINVTNNGPDTINAVITDTFDPAEATLANCSLCTEVSPGVLTWSRSNLTGTITLDLVRLRTSTSFSGTFTNTVTIAGTAALGVDPDPDNNTDSIGLPVRLPVADLQISKVRNGSGDVLAGESITYTLTITNASGDTVDAIITDTFDLNEATFVGCSDGCTGSGPLVWNIANFTNTRTLLLELRASPFFSGTLVNDAVIGFTVPSADPDPSDNETSESVPVRYPIADLQIVKETTAITAESGTLINYTITITNAGPDPADVVITDTFSPASAATVFDCSDSCGANPVTWSVNDLLGSRTLSLVLQTSSSFSGTLANTAEIGFAGIGIDPNGGNETGSVSVPIIFVPKLIYLPVVLKNFPAATPTPTNTPTPIVSVTPSVTPVGPTVTPGGPTLTPTPTATPTPQGDVTITGFSISPANPSSTDEVVVSITIQNQGTQSTGEGFWVDFYVNPQTLPNNPALGRDRRWSNASINSSEGIAWAVSSPLGPGESITLTSSGGFDPAQTFWSGQFGPGSYALYAFVDSFDLNDPTGPTNVELVETNENNNMSGPINVNVAVREEEVNSNDAPQATPAPLPPRSDLGAGSE